MEWHEEALLIGTRPHGESSVIATVFTRDRGVHAGLIRGGQSRKQAPVLQPGAQLSVIWRARLEDHIGSFVAEPVRSRAAAVMSSRLSLAGAGAVMSLLQYALPEREAHSALYDNTIPLMDLLGQDEIWPLAYLKWECALLSELGYGLELDRCAVTGVRDGLIYVSPKTGRAVSGEGAGEWEDRLLPLPSCLLGAGDADDAEIAEALEVTGHFLRSKVAAEQVGKPLPDARDRLLRLIRKRTT